MKYTLSLFCLRFNRWFCVSTMYLLLWPHHKKVICLTFFQVGSVSRIKENGSAPNSSPDVEGNEVEAELLVSSTPKQSRGVFGKLLTLVKKLCSTHQFQNEQVGPVYYTPSSKHLTFSFTFVTWFKKLNSWVEI